MKYGIKTIDDLELKDKTVLCRVDMNSPLKKNKNGFTDTTRINKCAPTIKELSDKNAKVVIMTHQGSDVEYHNYYNTEMHAAKLQELIKKDVKFIDDICGPSARKAIENLAPGNILFLDNVRFMAEEMTLFELKMNLTPEEQSTTQVVKKLSPLADYYICDAFAAAHRAQPTLIGFEEILPSAMGRLFEEEYTILSDIVKKPRKPCFFVLGGAKIQDAFTMMTSVLAENIVDNILTGGLLGLILLIAKGINIGEKTEELLQDNNLWEYVEISEKILSKYGEKIILPEDHAYIENSIRKEISKDELPVNKNLLVDIGHETVRIFSEKINSAGTVFFNGPLGVFEEKNAEYGTKNVLKAIAESECFSVLGGGDSITAIKQYGLVEGFSYICTGGGSLIRFLSGEELPVVKALKKSS